MGENALYCIHLRHETEAALYYRTEIDLFSYSLSNYTYHSV